MSTKENYINKRVAEGFTVEEATREWEKTIDPAIAEAQRQNDPTKGDIMLSIHEAIQNNADKKMIYTPDFALSPAYLALKKELDALKGVQPYDQKKAQDLSNQMLSIKLNGTIPAEEKQALIDKTAEMSIKQVITERNKYKKLVEEYTSKIDNFDLKAVEAKVDELTAEYEKKLRGKHGITAETIRAEYANKVDELEFKLITKPVNDLALKRWECKEHYIILEARVKYYVASNRDIIEEEIQMAKREEARSVLADLAEYFEEA